MVDPIDTVFAPKDAEFGGRSDSGERKHDRTVEFHTYAKLVGADFYDFRNVHRTEGRSAGSRHRPVGKEAALINGFSKHESSVPDERPRSIERADVRRAALGSDGNPAGRRYRDAGSRTGISKKDAVSRERDGTVDGS